MTGRRAAVVAVVASAVLAACASTPESRLRDELWDVYWTTARACGQNHTNFYVDNVKYDGSVTLVGHTSTGIENYRACYWKGVESGFEKRRSGGLVIPDGANPKPPVDIEVD